MYTVDLSELAYKYADNEQQWELDKYQYYATCGIVLACDSKPYMRKQTSVGYKANRYNLSDVQQLLKEKAISFKDKIIDDSCFKKLSFSGLEGDDILALLFICYDIEYLSNDKDLLQIETSQFTLNGTRRVLQLPKTLEGLISTKEQHLLALTLLGDTSDNIPKVAKGIKELKIIRDTILPSKTPFNDSYAMYGTSFLKNLYNVTLPYPAVVGLKHTTEDMVALCGIMDSKNWFNYVRQNLLRTYKKVLVSI